MIPTNDDPMMIVMSIAVIALGMIGISAYVLINWVRSRLRIRDKRDERAILSSEKVNSAIATNLQQEIGPILTASLYHTGAIQATDQHGRQSQEQAIGHLQTAIGLIKKNAAQLSPTAHTHSPFFCLSEFAAERTRSSELVVTIKDFEIPEISPQRCLHIYRILQEIVINAIKHSGAKELAMYGFVQTGIVTLIAVDNGIGFNVADSRRNTTGSGLQDMATRARLLDGKLMIRSKRGEGTTQVLKFKP